jgi:hypothetical protein
MECLGFASTLTLATIKEINFHRNCMGLCHDWVCGTWHCDARWCSVGLLGPEVGQDESNKSIKISVPLHVDFHMALQGFHQALSQGCHFDFIWQLGWKCLPFVLSNQEPEFLNFGFKTLKCGPKRKPHETLEQTNCADGSWLVVPCTEPVPSKKAVLLLSLPQDVCCIASASKNKSKEHLSRITLCNGPESLEVKLCFRAHF